MAELGEIASILFFLIGPMTIVEPIDSHNDFDIITKKINYQQQTTIIVDRYGDYVFFISAVR